MPVQIIPGNPADYSVGTPTGARFDDECTEFTRVFHVTHAFRVPEILRSGAVTGRLVYDQSGLRTTRTHVVWVSPNWWSRGSRYGTTALTFDWSRLIAGRQAYWVEVALYSPAACRILLSDRPQALRPYNATTRNGPWWWDTNTGKHYFNAKFCLEVMVEGDLPLSDIEGTDFADHHSDMCGEYRDAPSRCTDVGRPAQDAGARLVARLVGAGCDARPLRTDPSKLEGAWWWVRNWAAGPRTGTILGASPEGRSFAVAALGMYGTDRDDDARRLLTVFASEDDARRALKSAIEDRFGVDLTSAEDKANGSGF